MKTFLFYLAWSVLPLTAVAGPLAQEIEAVAARSDCAKYVWKNRGRAPAGYARGLSLSFARALCHREPRLFAPDRGDTRHDALAYYRASFQALHLRTDLGGAESLRALYTLAFGEGARESSGNYCTGWDESAGANRPSSAGEAGIFQSSYDSIGSAPELKALYDFYRRHPERCLLESYRVGARCRNQGLLGTGAGADFQAFTKACPAFGTDYAMILFRALRTHFGPINRREAEVVPACEKLLFDVQRMVEGNDSACAELDPN